LNQGRLGSCWNGEEEKKIVGKSRIGLRVEEEERTENRGERKKEGGERIKFFLI
jgi:hypothetical protein